MGDNVIVGNYLVGRIASVLNERSIVELITSPSLSIAAYDIDSPTRTDGVCSGQYGTSVIMGRILPNEDISVSDMILTSGKDGLFLPGLVIGKVSSIVQVPSEPLKSASLEALLDFSKLRKVFVVLD